MPYRILCNGVKREGVKARPDLASELFCYVPLHKIRYGILYYEIFGSPKLRSKIAYRVYRKEEKSQEVVNLTVQSVIDAWESIRKRTKQKNKSGMLSAYLAYFTVVEIERTTEQPVIVIKAEKATHLKYVKDEDHSKVLEWSLSEEFGQQCFVRLI